MAPSVLLRRRLRCAGMLAREAKSWLTKAAVVSERLSDGRERVASSGTGSRAICVSFPAMVSLTCFTAGQLSRNETSKLARYPLWGKRRARC